MTAGAPEVTQALANAGTTSIAYETVELAAGSLPLLTPMSQVAGRMRLRRRLSSVILPAVSLSRSPVGSSPRRSRVR